MKLTIKQLKQLIKEQVEEAEGLKDPAYQAEQEQNRQKSLSWKRENSGLRDPVYKAEQERNRQKSLAWEKEHGVEVGPSLEEMLDDLVDAVCEAARTDGEGIYFIDSTPEAKAMRALQSKIIAKFGK